MSDNVIRQDVIQIGFDTNLKVLNEILGQLDDIKKAANGTGESDGLDKVKKQANNANDSAKKLNDTLTKVGGTLGTVAKKAAGLTFKATAAGIGACATAVGALAAKAVTAYGEFEQLKGGVETLFGAKGAKTVEEYAKYVGKDVSAVKDEYKNLLDVEAKVIKYANDAYKTAGLSANDYMSTVTSFSASLIQSLGGDTKKAADLANKAIIDMSDNANKMGTDMGMIQNAYQGFAKQNYTMLDNLKLGYGGTKSEMERLLKDAGELANTKFDISSYADVIEAIHVIQENMGITGTTAKEANFTIQGSLNAAKAAWGNLMPALIKGGDDLDQCIDNLIESIVGFEDETGKLQGGLLNNLMPALEKGLEGIGNLVERIAPIIEEHLPGLIDRILPPLIRAGTSLFIGLAKALPNIIAILIKELPNIARMLGEGIRDAFGKNSFVAKIFDKIGAFFGGLTGNMESLKKVALAASAAIGGIFIAVKGFKAFKSITSLFSSIGQGSESVAKGEGPLSRLANMKTKTVLKGLGNLAIIIGGLTILAAALMFVAPYIAQLSDAKSILELLGVIALTGVVGGLLTWIAGKLGVIPVPVVLTGLANMAIMIAGFTAIVAAFAALNCIPGFNDFITKGGEVLANLCNILGKMVGSIIGGIGEGITNSLPKIGANISGFAEALKPMFTIFGGANLDGIGDFFGSLAGFLLSVTANDILSFFTGGSDLAQLGKDLTAFARNAEGFFDIVSGMSGFENISALFNALSSIDALPNSGGVFQFFTGDPYAGLQAMIPMLPKIATATKDFFAELGDITDFSVFPELFNALSSVESLPKAGGVFQFFTGDPYTALQEMVGLLPDIATSVGDFFENLGSNKDFSAFPALFNALSSVGAMPSAGGFFQFFTGDPYAALQKMVELLPGLGTSVGEFYTNLGEITDFSSFPSLFTALSSVGALPSGGGFYQFFTGDPYKGLAQMILMLPALGESVGSFYSKLGGVTDFSAISRILNALSAVSGLPSSGGFFEYFTGDAYTGMQKMAEILPSLATPVSDFVNSLSSIKDFSALSAVFNALSAVGALPSSGGFFQFFTGDPYTGLEKLAEFLPSLASPVADFLNTLSGYTDFTALTSVFNALSSVGALPSAGGFFQFFTGDPYTGLKELVTQLPNLGTSVGDFFTNLGDITDFSVITSLFNALASVDELPDAGGFAQFFTGDPYAAMKELILNLPSLGKSVSDFYTNLGDITDFSTISDLFSTLAGIDELPDAGGFAQFFTGTPYEALSSMTEMLPTLGESVKSFYGSIEGIEDFGKISELFAALGDLEESVGTEGGLLDGLAEIFGGSEESAIAVLGSSLKKFGDNTKDFFAQVNALDINNLNALWDSLERAGELTGTTITKVLDESIKTLVKKVENIPVLMALAITSSGSHLAQAINSIWKKAVEASIAPVNKLIEGANWILKKFGSDRVVTKWTPYARGTGGHPGGNAIVNDGSGAELVQMPNGHTFIPRGRNVLLPNAPKGMKVLDAKRTAQLMGRGAPTFRYASGTGDLDVWSYESGKSLINAVANKFVNYDGMSGYVLDAGKAIASTVKGEMYAWGEKLIDEFGAKGLGDYVPSAGVEQWRSTVIKALRMEGLYNEGNVNRTLYQMQTESGGNPYAINNWDSNAKKGIPSKGLMQVIDPTFRAYARSGYGSNIYDPLSNILASVRYATSRYGSLSRAYQGHGYANGIGGDTISIPHYSPAGSVSTTSKTETEYNSYAPVFNLTISGTTDDRTLANKVKRWVAEAMEECFEGMVSNNA